MAISANCKKPHLANYGKFEKFLKNKELEHTERIEAISA